MLRATCRAGGAFALAIMLALGVMARTGAADVREFEQFNTEAEVIEARSDKPITRLRCVARTADGTEVLRGTCVVYTMLPVDSA